ncbi:MAG: CHAT domain-containing tetratricopeptide repeat protein [Bryobacterales bacterium]|nr:CHAT domain-containing tetratricopeptide repeat protein [Bryobacteraceae bacterium]MDW8355280.1 CHAT domain-containing tetratricopeptide repeat protein [Bryobacterales bacterium]
MQYAEASRLFEQAYEEARSRGERSQAVRLLMNLGNCHFASFRYLDAIQAYLRARWEALDLGDRDTVAALSANLSSLYLQLGDLPSAKVALEESLRALPATSRHRAKVYSQAAVLRSREGDWAGADELFRAALRASDESPHPDAVSTKADTWEQLGYHWLQQDRLDEAERALVEAFRLRRLFRLPELQYSYYTLSLLRLRQGRPQQALRLLDAAGAGAGRNTGAVPPWRWHYGRGQALRALGRDTEALAELEAALESARRWRSELLPNDAVQVGAEGELHSLYAAYVELSAREHLRSGRREPAVAAFQASEENRAASLRALLNTPSDWQRRLPAAYWQQLAQVRALEAALAGRDTAETRRRLSAALYRLSAMEAAANVDLSSARRFGASVTAVQKKLNSREALLSFHLGEPDSYLWIVTRDGLRVRRLSPARRLEQLTERLAAAVRAGRPAEVEGAALYKELFGSLPDSIQRKPRWILTLDGRLYDAPLAALVTGYDSGKPVYLVERHIVTLAPSATVFEGLGWPHRASGLFVGYGDAIYNRADARIRTGPPIPRGPQGTVRASLWPQLFAASPSEPELELPRLVGSGRELEHCARIWQQGGGAAVLLRGREATRQSLETHLQQAPEVLHLATHMLETKYPRKQAHVFLGLGPRGDPELLTPVEIVRRRLGARLVVLSGCGSGRAEVLPSTGLLGLTRAWLGAGARAVVATLWSTPDDSGEFFADFYRELRNGATAAEALRAAQMGALRSGSWRARPSYWAAYFAIGKE